MNVWIFAAVTLSGLTTFAWIVVGKVRLILAGGSDGQLKLEWQRAVNAAAQIFGYQRLL